MLGIDLGSRRVKLIQMDKSQVFKRLSFDTVDFYRRYGKMVNGKLHINLKGLDLSEDSLVATGYGKMAVPVEGAWQIPEIQAHVKGAVYQSGLKDFTLLDVGGQDTKVVKVRSGKIVDFLTNDRCAAGSGRYLENMAAVLGVALEELSEWTHAPVELNSTCAIFAETEIISRIIEGFPIEELGAGVNYALFRRLAPLVKKLASPVIVMAGGGTQSLALHKFMADETGAAIINLTDPGFNGAIGCCVAGWEKLAREG